MANQMNGIAMAITIRRLGLSLILLSLSCQLVNGQTGTPVAFTSAPITPTTVAPMAPVSPIFNSPIATPVPVASPVQPPLTFSPTFFPTRTPSKNPSNFPTTVRPSKTPSTVPTIRLTTTLPTFIPSTRPSSLPTVTPTVLLSLTPSGAPTQPPSSIFPSLTPSLVGVTLSPTISTAPTASPSTSPTISPTASPIASRTYRPTNLPTASTNKTPSATPSAPPVTPATYIPTKSTNSAPLTFQEYNVVLVMTFEPLTQLPESSVVKLENATEDYIWKELSKISGVEDLMVITKVKDQQAQRFLRRRLAPLTLTVDARISFSSTITGIDAKRLLESVFDSEFELTQYLDRLTTIGGSDFANISTVQVQVNDAATGEQQKAVQRDDEMLYIIIGASAGGVVLLLLAGFLLCRRPKGAATGTPGQDKTSVSSGQLYGTGIFTQEIMVDKQDDISTLGDPMYGGSGMHMMGSALDKEDTVLGSNSIDYDYTKAYGETPSVTHTGSMMASSDLSSRGLSQSDMSGLGLGTMDSSLFSDDSSFEQQFSEMEDRIEVIAPAGKLGMVIDTPTDGVPVVHAIKDTSVLASKVQVGDRLVSVDDEDTTGMTAMQVSKLISIKADNEWRTLVFVRARERKDTEDL